ncbi:MAG: glycosyltransferase family 4 protein [Pseudomonadota bacterium]
MSAAAVRTRPKIWIVVFTGNSGLTHYSYCLARGLHEEGADVTLVTNRNYDMGLMEHGFPVRKVFRRTRRYPLDLIRFWLEVRLRRPDILHFQSFLKFPAVETMLLKSERGMGTGLVLTAHDWLPHHPRPWHRWLFRRFYRQFDRIIVHTPSGRDFLGHELGVDARRVDVIPHGEYGLFRLDPGLDQAAARERLGLDGRFWFLFFGRIDPHKGVDTAIRALARMPSASPDDGSEAGPLPGLMIAGDPGPAGAGEYRRLAAGLGVADRVRFFTGHIPVREVQDYFTASDAVLLPYRESSTSGIYHVAMGFEKPVVATAVGGLSDTVRPGVTGLLVPPGDEDALAAAMGRLASDEKLRKSLREGWSAVRGEHSWRSIARRTMKVYERLRPH